MLLIFLSVGHMAVKMTSLVKENFYCPRQRIYLTNMVEHLSIGW
jgi:hypothetical protein